MAEPEKKPPTDPKSQAPAQADQRAATPPAAPQADQREYVAKHKIRMGSKDKRSLVARGASLRLTDAEAARLGDAVELKR